MYYSDFLFQFGMFLEQKTANKTRSAIKELISLAPQKANRLFNDNIENIDDVQLNDIPIVKKGEKMKKITIQLDELVCPMCSSKTEKALKGKRYN